MTLRERIDELVELPQFGTMRGVARMLHIDVGYLSRLRDGKKTNPSRSVLRKLGIVAVTTYKRIGAGT